MSGISLAVAPRVDRDKSGSLSRLSDRDPAAGGLLGSLRVIELQLVAFILVFSVSGLVPLLDLAFPVFVSFYLLALSRWVFPTFRKLSTSTSTPEVFHGSRMFQLYVIVGTTLGLFLPLAYVLGGFARGDQAAVRAATPHLFLLSFQILSENIISGLALFSPPVRALVPLIYTARRLFALLDWTYEEFKETKLVEKLRFQDVAWRRFGQGLAVANLAYFAINLFCFVIPRFLPRAFERYFQERAEYRARMAEDKQSSAPQSQPHSQPSVSPHKQKKSE